jgi:hypothetical protein
MLCGSTFAGAFLLSISAYAQPFSLGVIGGASLTEDFQNYDRDVGYGYTALAYSTPYRWMAGGTAEARLPFHLSVEVDGIFHELEFSTQVLGNGLKPYLVPAHVVTWEFPILVKYRFPLPAQFSTWSRVKPFIDAGPAFRSAGNLSWTSPSNDGVAAGLGVEVHLWKLKIASQFRYLRWARDQNIREEEQHFVPSTVVDQVEFLTAISFP